MAIMREKNPQTPGVYIEEVPSGARPIQAVGTRTAGFVGVAPDPAAPLNRAVAINNWTEFRTRFFPENGSDTRWTHLAHGVYGFFLNGGSRCYVVNVGRRADGSPKPISGGGGVESGLDVLARIDEVAIVAAPGYTDPTSYAALLSHCINLHDRVAILDGPSALTAEALQQLSGEEADQSADSGEEVEAGVAPETKTDPHITTTPGRKAEVGKEYRYNADAEGTRPISWSLEEGPEGMRINARSGLVTWTPEEAGDFDLKIKAVNSAGESEQSFTLRVGSAAGAAALVEAWVKPGKSESGETTLYVPWIKVSDPNRASNGKTGTVTVPPSGHIAGVWARSDALRGVHKAPANEILHGVLDLEYRISYAEQGPLNFQGINCIRYFTNEGFLVWGARTFCKNSNWKYLNVRRLFNMIEESIAESTRWIVFEPNDRTLWNAIRRDVSAFLMGFWRDGALMGRTAEEAFYVKCDEENNTIESINDGRVVIEIGIAPVKPAEFVMFKISQYEAGTEVEVEEVGA
jgi:hypothetical protein